MSGVLKNGARFALKLTRQGPEQVVYEASIELPGGSGFSRQVSVDIPSASSNSSSFSAFGEATGSPAQWMVEFLETLTQQLIRSGLKSGRWPRKQRRWKDRP